MSSSVMLHMWKIQSSASASSVISLAWQSPCKTSCWATMTMKLLMPRMGTACNMQTEKRIDRLQHHCVAVSVHLMVVEDTGVLNDSEWQYAGMLSPDQKFQL